MILTILGLAITTIVSIEGTVTSDRPRRLKLFLHFLAISAFAVALASAIHEDHQKAEKEQLARQTSDKLDAANRQLAAQGILLDFVKLTVGDLGKLNELAAGQTYHVTIASDDRRDNLNRYLEAIQHQFSGASASGLVTIREPIAPSRKYKLVFGRGIDLAAAQVFQQLAATSQFSPLGQPPRVERDDR